MLRLALCLVATLASPALAHPHVFIDAGITVMIDEQDRLTGFRIRWDYDDYVSLVLVTDMGADVDGDGSLTQTELIPLQGFDMTWVEGFDGDAVLMQDDRPIALQKGPQDWATGWQDTHLWTEHGRKPMTPVDLSDGPVTIVIRDVTDYTAYTLTTATLASAPPGCRITIIRPDDSAAPSGMGALLGLFLFPAEAAPTPITTEQSVRIACDG